MSVHKNYFKKKILDIVCLTLCVPRMYIYSLAVPCTQPLYMHLEHIKDIYTFLGVGKNSPGTQRVKEHSKFQNFCEIFYNDMTRPRSMNFNVFIQYQYARTILRKKNMGHSLFKKHWKFRNFDEISAKWFWVIVVSVDTWSY